jgi:hypothetical protein
VNDELHELRSFRPDGACPTDAQVIDGRTALMNAIDAEGHPLLRSPRRRRRVAVAAAVVAAVVVGVAGAAVLGVPDDVTRALGLAGNGDPALVPDAADAVMRATSATPDGGTAELWTAPTSGGGACAYVRLLDVGGAPVHPGAVTCQNVGSDGTVVAETTHPGGPASGFSAGLAVGGNGAGGGLDLHLQWTEGDPLTLFGQAPAGATEVVVTLDDGTTATAPVTDGGWYVAAVASDAGPAAIASVVARAADGSTLASVAPPPPPQQPRTQAGP